MTLEEAKQNIGKRFKLIDFASDTGALGRADTILSVDDDGTIHGKYFEAPAEACRLVGEQPEQLKKGGK